ncbi:MAG: PKD domain-containing protein, partial [Desulfobacterales bacterium]|nr:PKD domain-containing protein [Desulfobacterales bacterium]
MSFYFMHHDDEYSSTYDKVWIRGGSGNPWIEIYNWGANKGAPGVWHYSGNLDVDARLSANGQSPTSTFQIRFGQYDNASAASLSSGDGLTIDHVRLTANVTPLVNTNSVTSISRNYAYSGGYVTSAGAATVTSRGVCWSTSPNPTTADSRADSGSGTGSYGAWMTGLNANTTYYARAFATNAHGTSYGANWSFTTTQPTVYFTASSQAGAENGGAMSITARLSNASGLDVTMPFSVSGTATGGGTDYTITESPITIPAGSIEQTITITPNDDALDEYDETVIATMGSPTNAAQGTTTVHMATITDNDASPTIYFTTSSQSRWEHWGVINVTARLSAPSGRYVHAPVSLGGSATGGGTDYSFSVTTISIPTGWISRTYTISLNNDALDEHNETVSVTMGSPAYAIRGAPYVHTATILDDDATPTVSFTSAAQAKAENLGNMLLTARLSAVSGRSVYVHFSLGGTATGGGKDYGGMGSYIWIPAGWISRTHTIPVINDALDEDDETVIVTMGSPSYAIQGETAVHTATITDDDDPPAVSFTSAARTGAEDVGTMTITAQLSAESGLAVDVPFTMSGAATGGGTDYSITASPVTIPAGATSGAITISVEDDALDENDETVIATMGSPVNATQGATAVHTATITDNDDPPTISFTSASQTGAEIAGVMTITAQLSAVSALPVTLPFSAGGTAVEGAGYDYTITASPIVISPGDAAEAITITVNDDGLDEEEETVIVTMGAPTNATPGATTENTTTITDSTDAPAVSFTSADQSGLESAGTMTITARLSAVSGLPVSVPFSISGSATGGGTDYAITPGPVTIPAGATTAGITISVNDDALDENDETVIVAMGAPNNAANGAIPTHTATLVDNDETPTVSFTSAGQTGAEDGGDMTFTAELSAVSGRDVAIPLALDGTADEGAEVDFTITPNPAIIAAGATTRTITIAVNDDLLDEDDETVIATMGALTNAERGATASHTATIEDNETTPVADAGPDQIAAMETRVDLDASGSSDSDNRIVIFRWSQIGGEPVRIDNVHLEKTFFTAPRVDANQELVFQLEVEDVDGLTDSDEVTVTITFIPPPEASFTADPITGAPPLEVAFTDGSAGEITGWKWDFGDGGESTDQNPTHAYDEAGTYTAVLTATGPGGEDSFSMEIEVIHPAPVVDFTAAPTSGPSPLSVSFSSEIEGEVDSLVWDFGDGSGSSDENPTHLYEDFGEFTVKLTAIGPGGEGVMEKTELIEVVERFISGRVTTLSNGRSLVGLENCRVEVYSADGPEGDAITAADGSFTIGQLPGIDGMTALALPPAGSKEYYHQYFNMKKERVDADAVSTIGGDLVDVDFILDRIPDLGMDGRIMDKDGPLAGARVNIYSASAQSGVTVESDANGEYTASNLQAADDYRISVRSDALETTFFYAIPSGAPGDGAPSYSVFSADKA